MNYQKIYNDLILRAKNRQLDGYKEKHHIIPRCMGGSNDASNLAVLTAGEHFVAHQLLVKIYPNHPKLIWACRLMTASSKGQIRNNKEYEWIRKRIIAHLKATRTGVKTGKQRIFHIVDPYITAIEISKVWSLMNYYDDLYKPAEDIINSSNLLLKFFERW